MKQILTFAFICLVGTIQAQNYNLNLLGTLDGYPSDISDIWSYHDAANGVEYAIMGEENGTAIISLADPTNPVQVEYINGGNTIWRDMKAYGNYVYVTSEANDGVLIVDMTDANNGNFPFNFYKPNLTINGVAGTLGAIHNIYIDEDGYMYLSGSNLNNGAVIIFDLNNNPTSPDFISAVPTGYSHDAYVQDNILWSSNLNSGLQAIDVSNKSNPTVINTQTTSSNFTHNAWTNASGNFVYTTDEVGNGRIDAYDVSDLNNIQMVDSWVPVETEGLGVIPHNVHVLNDYLVISYYTDGLKVVDAARPHNLIEVGSYDTYLGGDGGFSGCWGTTPFTDSGLILASDIQSGLFVFQPNYQRACYLEGNITDANTGLPINGASIEVLSTINPTELSASNGDYATGQVTPGTFQVVYSAVGYISQTITVTMVNGQLLIQDVALVPSTPTSISGQVVLAGTGAPVSGATVRVSDGQVTYDFITDASGQFNSSSVLQSNYEVYAGKWGYSTAGSTLNTAVSTSVILELEQGYEDPFAVDLGWTVNGNADAGVWEIGEPRGTSYQGSVLGTDSDVVGDVGDWCYVTGNQGSGCCDDDIDGGTTNLSSPIFDLTSYSDPIVEYQTWFVNVGGSGAPNDRLEVVLDNGSTQAVLETVDISNPNWSALKSFRVADYLAPTSNMRIIFSASDDNPGHLVEVAVDNFKLSDLFASSNQNLETSELGVIPNPFSNQIRFEIPTDLGEAQLSVFDMAGRRVMSQEVNGTSDLTINTAGWASGVYQVAIQLDDKLLIRKIVKH